MADADDELTVAQRLGSLLDRGLLPAGGPAEAAERLIERLERSARVALLGLPGSGKSAILNLLAGSIVVPETLRLPTMIVQYGRTPRMLCTLSDGRNEIIPGDNLEESLTLSPALITLELDLPALKVISLLEIAAGPLESDQRRAALWAGKRADILIWCTTSYLPKEQLVWEGMPDSFKDNGFLLLTKVDLLGGHEAVAGMHHRVEQRAGGEFRQILSISAKDARAATLPSGQVDRDRFRESGAGSVISAIKTRVQSARRADTDTAELILARQAGPFESALQEPAAAKAPVAPVRPPELEKPLLTIVAKLPPTWEPVVAPDIATMPAPEIEPVGKPEALLEGPAEKPAASEPEVLSVREPLSEITTKAVIELETQAFNDPVPKSAAGIETVVDPFADAEPAVDVLAELQAAPVVEPKPVKPDDPEPASYLNAVMDSSPKPATGFLTTSGGQRLSDRIKQIRPSGTTTEVPLVPLRATWKSRNDVSPPPAKPPAEPVRMPRPRPVDPSNGGRHTFRVSPSKEVAGTTRDVAQQETDAEASAGETLKEKQWSDVSSPNDDVVQDAQLDPTQAEEKVESAKPAIEEIDPAEVKRADVEDPALARLSAMRAPHTDISARTLSHKAEPEAEPAPEIPPGNIAEDPTLARLSALRDPRPGTSVEVRRDTPEPPVEPRTHGAADALPRASGDPRDAPASVTDVSIRQPLSARLSEAVGQTSGTLVEAAAYLPPLGPRIPRSGAPGSPRVTVLRERLVEVQPGERTDSPRITSAEGPADPASVDEPQIISATEARLLDLAIDMIVTRSAELFAQIEPTEKLPVDLILGHGCETTDKVIDVLSKGNSAEMRRINGSLSELQDVIMLMQLEKGHAPADDTLTLLLQLKREMETLRPQ